MGQYFNFSRLIKKYESDFSAITQTNGYRDYDNGGEWVAGETLKTSLKGAIFSQSENKIFRSEGALTEKDKQLVTLFPIDEKLHGARIIYEGNEYKIMNCVENAKFTGVYVYTLKYVSAFNDTTPETDFSEAAEKLSKRLDGKL